MQKISDKPLDVFVEGWGRMGSGWGVGKVMAEIQALLYLSAKPLSLDEMADRLKLSRSNISLNVRGLQDLGAVRKLIVPGDRKDYYTADENVGHVARRLAAEKKRRELDPALDVVDKAIRAAQSNFTENDGAAIDIHRLYKLKQLIEQIGGILDAFIDSEPSRSREETTPARQP